MRPTLFEEMGFAKIDQHRAERCGSPEAVFCEGKTPEQVAQIVQKMNEGSHNILATRADAETFAAVKKSDPRRCRNVCGGQKDGFGSGIS